jgi:cell division protein FtsQ
VLDAPALRRASARADSYGPASDDSDEYADGFEQKARQPGLRLSFRSGLLPKTVWGRVAAGCGVALVLGSGVAAMLAVRSFLLRDEHFTVASSSSIQIDGNSHLTRPQLLSVFGGDVERNIFTIPLAERRAELESLPWVQHATVMRLLPDRVRVAIVERTPVAFVRQGKEIGLVDAHGVLLDLGSLGNPGDGHGAQGEAGREASLEPNSLEPNKDGGYSFPVLTGISATDPLSTRAARMKIYTAFIAELDSTGEKISQRLSEVDLSNPEDVRAILPDGVEGVGNRDILVHFGEERFLERYRQYQQHLAEWLTQYPKLASVDMRYERQVVLEMQPGAAASADSGAATGSAGVAGAASVAKGNTPKSMAQAASGGAAAKGTAEKAGVVNRVAAKEKPGAAMVAAAKPLPVEGGVAPGPGLVSPQHTTQENMTQEYTTHLTTAFPVGAGAASSTAARPAGKAAAASQQGAPR